MHNENQTSVDLNLPLTVECEGSIFYASGFYDQITNARLTYDARTNTLEIEYLHWVKPDTLTHRFSVVKSEVVDLVYDAEMLALLDLDAGHWNVPEVELLFGAGMYFVQEGAQS